ncbi:putative ribonuclease H-like domain-containing protein [Tanacetum coccineum]
MIRNKARLVAQGYTQEEGNDYDEVFVFVARIEAIRLFLAYASFKDFVVYQMDVKSAFLYGKIEEEVYVCQPLGFEDPNFPDRVYKVEKALYGLHQAPRAWYETLSTYLLDNEFQRGKIDKTLFIKRYKGDILLVQVYVNDIIFGLTKKELCLTFEKLMHEIFKMSSMGELTFFLGLQVKQKKYGIFISQDKYVDKNFKKFRFTKVKTASIPMETQKPLLKDEDGEEVDVHMYRSMIGSLMYLTSSRLDIMFAVCACAKYQVNPKISHLHAVKRICLQQAFVVKRFHYLIAKYWNAKSYEAIYKELDDSLVRAATTASSLEAEQDSGNINKTHSKAIPNESSSIGTTLGGGPRGNTLRSGEDSLKVKELMELCTKLQTRVLDLEKTKTTQAEEIVSLKRRVKKLKHKKRSRTHGLKRLYKVGLTARVESFGDEESLCENASKQGRINAIDADEDITLVNDQDDADMFDVNTLTGDEVLAKQEVATKDVNLTVNEVTLAQAVAALKSVKPKVKANVVEEPSIPASAASTKVSAATTTTIAIIPTPRKGNVITELEEPVKMKKKDQNSFDEQEAKRLQVVFDEEERLAREKDEANVGSKTAS